MRKPFCAVGVMRASCSCKASVSKPNLGSSTHGALLQPLAEEAFGF